MPRDPIRILLWLVVLIVVVYVLVTLLGNLGADAATRALGL